MHSLTSFVDPQTHSRHLSRTILIKVGTPSSFRTSFDSRRVCFAFLTDSNWCFFSLFILIDVSGFQTATEINFSELFWQLTKDFCSYNRKLVLLCGLDLITKIPELATTFFANFTFQSFEPFSPARAPFTCCPAECLRALDFGLLKIPPTGRYERVTYGLLCDPFTISDIEFIKTCCILSSVLCDLLFPFFTPRGMF